MAVPWCAPTVPAAPQSGQHLVLSVSCSPVFLCIILFEHMITKVKNFMIIKSWSQLFPCQFFFWSKYHHHFTQIKNPGIRNFLACQWLGLCAFTAKGVGSIPVWGTKILQASWYGQKNQNRKQTNKKKQTPKTMASSLTEICFSLTFYIKSSAQYYKGFPGGSDSKESTYNAGDLGFNP